MQTNFSLDMKTSKAYGRIQLAAKPTRSEVAERRALHNHAFRTAQLERNAKPRLVRGNEPPARVLSLADFLSSVPAVDIIDVTLASGTVATFDKAAIVSASL